MTDYVIEVTQAAPVTVQIGELVTHVVHGSEVGTVQVVTPASTTHVVEATPAEPIVAVQFVAGPPGPQGEEMVFAERTDFATETIIYKAQSVPGTSESASGWRIYKLELGVDGDVTKTWAEGSAAFSFAWSNHLTYTYS